jgi:hypothetical protein
MYYAHMLNITSNRNESLRFTQISELGSVKLYNINADLLHLFPAPSRTFQKWVMIKKLAMMFTACLP